MKVTIPGASSFTQLSDVPHTYLGAASKVVGVNVTETGLEFNTGGPGGSGITRTVTNITGNTNAGSTASTDYVYNCTGPLILTLPTAVGNTNQYTVKRVSGAVTIATTSAQTIDGSASASLTVDNMSLDLVSNGSNWNVV